MKHGYLSILASVGFAVLICGPSHTLAQTPPALGAAQSFAVLGALTVTNTGSSVITGDLGVSPGSAVTGFPPGIVVSGAIHAADAAAFEAQTSVTAAYNHLVSQPCTVDLTGQDLGGLTLTAGVYCFSSSALLTGTLTLNAQGNAGAAFIFKIGSTLTTASGSSVVMSNGGTPCNVFWQVGSAATLGTAASFAGNLLALSSISLNSNASVTGRVLTQAGAVTLTSSSVTASACAGPPPPTCPPITLSPATLPDGRVAVAYSQSIVGIGGTAPYTFTVVSGSLPSGLNLASAGVLAGTPSSAGTSIFTIRGTDANGCFASRSYTIIIAAAPPPPTVQFSLAASSGLESAPAATLSVSMSAAAGQIVTVNYATANGTAIAGSDYTATSGTLSFTPGVTNQTLTVPITNDTVQEPDETFTVTLTTPGNATLGAITTHTRSIYDDGVPGVAGLKAIAVAVDQPTWTFTTTVSANWWLQTAVTHDGWDAGRSGFIADNQASSFQTTGSFGVGTVSFWWKVSSEPGADLLRFSIDGIVRDTISGEVGWQQKSYAVTAGSHTLKWEYAKDGSAAGGIDAGWVDQVVLPAALVLWARSDTGEANLWVADSSTMPAALAVTGRMSMKVPSDEGGPWEATSCAHADAATDYVLWSRGDTGQAILARIDTTVLPGVDPVRGWAYLSAPAGDGGPWLATSYSHQDAATGYVLWTRSDTGLAILGKVASGNISGTIPVVSWAYLHAPTGVGGPWQATSYTHVDAATGYVLWSRSDTGQAILWQVVPEGVTGTIPVTSWAYLTVPAGVGEHWLATSYTHVNAAEGYVLWTRSDAGQAILWQVVPGDVSGTIPVTSWVYVSESNGQGGPWRAAGYAHGATPFSPAAAGVAPPDAIQQGDQRRRP